MAIVGSTFVCQTNGQPTSERQTVDKLSNDVIGCANRRVTIDSQLIQSFLQLVLDGLDQLLTFALSTL